MSKKIFAFLSLLIVASMVLAACGGTNNAADNSADTTNNAAANDTADNAANDTADNAADDAAVDDEPDMPMSTRTGAWVDQVAMTVVSSDAAVTQLEAGAIDIFSSALANPAQIAAAQEAGMEMATTFGLYYELTMNPSEFATGFNPFYNGNIRQAMNWLVDRDYINQEVYGGTAIPKFFSVISGFPDYAKHVEYARAVEAKFSYDFAKAEAVITEEMVGMGAEMVDGKWTFGGEPVVLVFLIRNDSDGTRVPIGDYISNQLESIGFAVDRQYKTSSEASPLWIGGDPADGLWHIYTGAWAASAISRDDGSDFQFFYTPEGIGVPLWTAYGEQISDEFIAVSDALAYNTFTTPEERAELFGRAMELVYEPEQATRVWLIDGQGRVPWIPNVSVASDLAAGVNINSLWPYTLKFDDAEGGLLKFGTPDLFVDPANPIGGSNWTYDTQWRLATEDAGTFANPHTGVPINQRIERVEITVTEGLPVSATYDYVDLSFASEIVVPAGTWVDWDAESQTFVEADGSTTAILKSVVYYPADMFESHSWHDGSPLTVADFVMAMIMTFEPGKEASALYDESAAAALDAFMPTFKGFAIASTDPLVVEFYTDVWYLDAEYNIYSLWPEYGFGNAPWHAMAMGNSAEAAGELAYTADKAEILEVEWQNWIGGPSLDILSANLDALAADGTVPYAATMGDFTTAEEASARYANLQAFYGDHGHFWTGTGPFVLDEVYLVEKTLTLTRNEAYPDLSAKWDRFSTPKLSEVEVDGPGRVTIGGEATFEVYVTFEGDAYPGDEVDFVKYLLFDATGAIVEVGVATFVEDGYYEVTLSADTTSALEAGAGKIEVAVVAIPVAVPSFGTFEFVAE